MKLQNVINYLILKYPLLFKAQDYETSELLVLEQLFLINGNGLEWTKDGTLDDLYEELPKKEFILPKKFFEKREVISEKMFDKDHELYKLLEPQFEKLSQVREGFYLKDDGVYYRRSTDAIDRKFNPYPICQYAKSVTAPDNIQEDYRKGMVKVIKEALKYFEDADRRKSSHYYPTEARIEKYKKDFAKLRKEGRFKKVAVGYWGAKIGEKAEDFVYRNFEVHIKEQIKYCNDILEKWDRCYN